MLSINLGIIDNFFIKTILWECQVSNPGPLGVHLALSSTPLRPNYINGIPTKISFLQLFDWVINLSSSSNSRKTKPISSFVFFSTSEQWTKTASLCFDRNSLRFVGEQTIEPKSDCQKFLWRHRFIKHWFWDTWALRSTQPWTQSENNFNVDLRWILLNQKYWSRIPL